MSARSSLSMLVVLALAAAPAAAQNPLDEAKAQYAAAAYEEALSALTRARNARPASRVEIEQYRAFCFIALGRMAEAEQAVAALLDADPKFTPSPSVASPRVLSLVSEMRKKELPAVARRLLDAGRTAYQAKDYAAALENLSVLLQLLDEPAMKERPEAADLRVIADGFVTLSTAAAATPAAAAVEPAPTLPTFQADVLTDPVPVEQTVPVWAPPNAIAGSREFAGAIRVRIGADGRVKSAAMEKPTYPSYDARLLQAARDWVYKPATRNGQPVESERVIPIQLRPRS